MGKWSTATACGKMVPGGLTQSGSKLARGIIHAITWWHIQCIQCVFNL